MQNDFIRNLMGLFEGRGFKIVGDGGANDKTSPAPGGTMSAGEMS